MRKLQIQVLTRDGRKNIFETDRFRNVADLKKHIGRSMNVPMTFSKLTYKGRLLSNDSILEDEGVKRLSTLELYWQPLVMTPKQYREKEMELEKLEQKQRHLSRLADNSEATTSKKGNHERVSIGSRTTRGAELLQEKPSANEEDAKLVPKATEEPNSESSEELDFLSVYWCCPKKSLHESETKLELGQEQQQVQQQAAANTEEQKHQSESSSSSSLYHDSEEEQTLAEVRSQRCFCWNPTVRPGVRLAAGRISHSIIFNIRKHQKNCQELKRK
ncbi:uncharacterized protein LOC117578264 [Drosophila albomicans]|uniref:Uncharacterized protein LOC117578264 n=1 Tax=Drosophila albomicans TaxID=7291 RepID=A0A6P8ZGA8_DROAB|nr:uncharacterized protein LOC117578264 [Drosophila albomicans]